MILCKKSTLPNGLRLVAVEMPHLHSAEIAVYVKAGGRNDTAEKAGMAHFLEHMLFRGTADYPTTIELETASAFVNYNNASSSLQIQKRNMDLAKNIYTVSQKKYEQGVGSNLEVINAQASLKESETNYFNAVYDLLVYKIDYLKATGSLVK